MPIVLPVISRPMNLFFSQPPARVEASASTTWRASASMRATTSSATALALAPGVFITSMPRFRAALMSMLSYPAPARTTTLRAGSRFMISGPTFSLRTISA